MIGRNGERRSGISAQAARHDDDDKRINGKGKLGCYKLDDRVMTHNIPLAREKRVTMETTTYPGWDSESWSLSYDQAYCAHSPFVECYAVQAFSTASDLDPKLMPKEKNQIMI